MSGNTFSRVAAHLLRLLKVAAGRVRCLPSLALGNIVGRVIAITDRETNATVPTAAARAVWRGRLGAFQHEAPPDTPGLLAHHNAQGAKLNTLNKSSCLLQRRVARLLPGWDMQLRGWLSGFV